MTNGFNNELIVCYSNHDLNNIPFGDQTVFNHLNTKLVLYSVPTVLNYIYKPDKIRPSFKYQA